MAIFSAPIRSGPLPVAVGLAVLSFAFAAGSAAASDATRHYYSIHGSLTPAQSRQTTANGNGLQLKSTLRSSRYELPVQSGGGLDLIAKLAVAPTVCYSDTIFRDGFDYP